MMSHQPVTSRPEHPNGQKYRFNCCSAPDVVKEMSPPVSSERKEAWCRSCGYDWTEALDL